MTCKRIFELAAATSLAAVVCVAVGITVSRYFFGFVPVWSEPVMTGLVLLSTSLAVGPGLHERVHVAIHFVTDRLSARQRSQSEQVVSVLTLLLGLAFVFSGVVYTSELWSLGVSDFAGIPQWLPASIAVVFGATLALFATLDLRR